jgi:hypothetical protein
MGKLKKLMGNEVKRSNNVHEAKLEWRERDNMFHSSLV